MRKIIVMAAIAGVLAMAHPGFADALPPSVPDHGQVAAAIAEASGSPSPARPSPDAKAPAADTGLGKNSIPVGFGWG